MLRVLIDSSILRSENPDSVDMRRLGELCRIGCIQLHVPELVVKEVATGLAEDANISTPLRKAINRASGWLPPEHRERTRTAVRALGDLRDNAPTIFEDGLRSWLAEHRAVCAPISDIDSTEVFQMYFRGIGPFGTPKSRKDLPDAFIFMAAMAIARSEQSPLCAIVDDGRLREALVGLPNTTCFRNLKSFLQSEIVNHELALLDPRSQPWLRRAVAACREQGVDLETLSSDLVDGLQQFEFVGNFPSDDGLATIQDPGTPGEIEIQWDSAVATGDGSISVVATCELCDAIVDLMIYKSDFWSLREDRRQAGRGRDYALNDGDWSEHYVWASTWVSMTVVFLVAIDLRHEDSLGDRVLVPGEARVSEVQDIIVEAEEPSCERGTEA